MPYYVYILQSESTSQIYIGQTTDLERRLAQHNDPSYKRTLHTKRRKGPWRIIYSEQYPSRAQAIRREKRLKSGMGRKWIKETIVGKSSGC